MRLLADENIDRSLVARLRREGHHVVAVVELAPGITDEEVLDRANEEGALLLTEDKDFGELAHRQHLVHQGVVLLRLAGLASDQKASLLVQLIERHERELPGAFSVVSPGMIRIRRG